MQDIFSTFYLTDSVACRIVHVQLNMYKPITAGCMAFQAGGKNFLSNFGCEGLELEEYLMRTRRRPISKGLTPTQRATWEFMHEVQSETGYPASLSTIADHFHINRNAAKERCDGIVEKGFAHKDENTGHYLAINPREGGQLFRRQLDLPRIRLRVVDRKKMASEAHRFLLNRIPHYSGDGEVPIESATEPSSKP